MFLVFYLASGNYGLNKHIDQLLQCSQKGYITKGYITKGYITKGYITKGYIPKGYITKDYITKCYVTKGGTSNHVIRVLILESNFVLRESQQ